MSRVKCPGCERSVELTPKLYGKKVKCPCGKHFQMPTPSVPVVQQLPASAPIQFSCPNCEMMLQVDGSLAGQLSKCPCGTQIAVPNASIGLNEPVVPAPLVAEPTQNHAASNQKFDNVPAYHKRNVEQRKRAERAKERAKSQGKKKKQKPQQEEDNQIAATVWAGVVMLIGGGTWLVLGVIQGYLYYGAVALVVGGLFAAVFGALFGDVEDDDF